MLSTAPRCRTSPPARRASGGIGLIIPSSHLQVFGNPDTPPVTRTGRGTLRRVGVEVEFMGLSVREAVAVLAAGLGGVAIEEDPHAATILNTRMGDLKVELDLRHAHPQRHAETLPFRL